jgi:hypothetical protein
MSNLFRTTDKSPFAAIMAGICLAVLHVVVTAILAFVAPTFLKFLNVFGIALGTITLAVAVYFSDLPVFNKWMTIIGIAILNVLMTALGFGLDAFLGTSYIAFALNGFAIIVLCPFAFGLMIYNLPTDVSDEEANRPASATVITIDSRTAVAWLRRFEYRLDLLLTEFGVNDDTDTVHPMSLDIVTLFLRVEHKLELLVSNFSSIDDRTDDRFPKPDTN